MSFAAKVYQFFPTWLLQSFAGTFSVQKTVAPKTVNVSITIWANGSVTVGSVADNIVTNTIGSTWCTQPGVFGSSIYVKATLVSGTAPDSGALDTMQLLDVNRTWEFTRTTTGTTTCQLGFDFYADPAGSNYLGGVLVTLTGAITF